MLDIVLILQCAQISNHYVVTHVILYVNYIPLNKSYSFKNKKMNTEVGGASGWHIEALKHST